MKKKVHYDFWDDVHFIAFHNEPSVFKPRQDSGAPEKCIASDLNERVKFRLHYAMPGSSE